MMINFAISCGDNSDMVLSMDRWVGKVAIVTGAAGGIGSAIAEQLVENGLIVVGIDLRPELIEERAKKLSGKKGQLHAVKCDLIKEEEILEAFDWITKNLGPVHILVNCAGTCRPTNLTDGDTESWRLVLDLNVVTLCICTREAVKIMKANNINGHIVHLNSVRGHSISDFPDSNVYPASKYAITALTETLRRELNQMDSKIKVTSVSPGLVATELTTLNKKLTPEKKALFGKAPTLKGEDIADGVVYVLSTPEHVQIHELMIKPIGEKF